VLRRPPRDVEGENVPGIPVKKGNPKNKIKYTIKKYYKYYKYISL
jgi:hypothetical protein